MNARAAEQEAERTLKLADERLERRLAPYYEALERSRQPPGPGRSSLRAEAGQWDPGEEPSLGDLERALEAERHNRAVEAEHTRTWWSGRG